MRLKSFPLPVALLCAVVGCATDPVAVGTRTSSEAEGRTCPRAAWLASRDVVPVARVAELRDLLAAGQVDAFHRRRRSRPFAAKVLELSSSESRLVLRRLDLRGADLSACVLSGADFTGADLSNASFRDSYLIDTQFYEPFDLEHPVPPALARPTRLDGADFTDAVVIEERLEWDEPTRAGADLHYTDVSTARGLPDEVTPRFGELARAVVANRPNAGRAFFLAGEPLWRALDVRRVAKPCRNPFEDVAVEDCPAWKACGVDVPRLAALRAVRVEGDFCGTYGRTLLNRDPATVLVLGSPFVTHGGVYSLGPVVALEGAHFMGNVVADAPVWFRDESFPRLVVFGRPIVLDASVNAGHGSAVFSPIYRTPGLSAAEPNAYIVRMLKDRPIARVAVALGRSGEEAGRESKRWMRPGELKQLLGPKLWEACAARCPEIRQMKAVAVGGQHFGSVSDDVISTQRDVVLVLEKGFSSHSSVFAAGPVIALGDNWAQYLLSQRWILTFGTVEVDKRVALETVARPGDRPPGEPRQR